MIDAHRLVVSGTVQGVGFRWFVREHARALGLAGWVRNESTGEVTIEVAGPSASVAQLISLVRQGPPGSLVREVAQQRVQGSADQLPTPFAVHR